MAPSAPASVLAGLPLTYAVDDGMPFPGWSPPPLDEDEAAAAYARGDRFAVIGGDPHDPAVGLVVDRRNARVALTLGEGRVRQLVRSGKHLAVSEARWRTDEGCECWATRVGAERLSVRRRPLGAVVWVEELLARREPASAEPHPWPEFGDWDGLARLPAPPDDWWDDGSLPLVDADGWLLDVLAGAGLGERWRELARRHDAPRAVGLPPDVQARLAEPRGWRPQGRRWRRAAEVDGAVLLTDVAFSAGAGGAGEVTLTVSYGDVEVTVALPAAVARLETRASGSPSSPTHPRPSTGAQVAVAAVLDLAAEAHSAVAAAIRAGAIPAGWAGLSAPPT